MLIAADPGQVPTTLGQHESEATAGKVADEALDGGTCSADIDDDEVDSVHVARVSGFVTFVISRTSATACVFPARL